MSVLSWEIGNLGFVTMPPLQFARTCIPKSATKKPSMSLPSHVSSPSPPPSTIGAVSTTEKLPGWEPDTVPTGTPAVLSAVTLPPSEIATVPSS